MTESHFTLEKDCILLFSSFVSLGLINPIIDLNTNFFLYLQTHKCLSCYEHICTFRLHVIYSNSIRAEKGNYWFFLHDTKFRTVVTSVLWKGHDPHVTTKSKSVIVHRFHNEVKKFKWFSAPDLFMSRHTKTCVAICECERSERRGPKFGLTRVYIEFL